MDSTTNAPVVRHPVVLEERWLNPWVCRPPTGGAAGLRWTIWIAGTGLAWTIGVLELNRLLDHWGAGTELDLTIGELVKNGGGLMTFVLFL